VPATLKLGSGRTDEAKRRAGAELFAAMKAHFAALYDRRYLALSLEIAEFSEAGTWKHNNIHARFKGS
jgi:5-carboxymethyl-2-hydroxymuconate isomerase